MENPRKVIQNLFSKYKDSKLLLAVSGGLDSMVLATIFSELKYNISIAHVNYNLRDADSTKDEEFVKQFTINKNIPFYCKSMSLSSKNNLQAVARTERYLFFDYLRIEEGFDYIVTAHHADDLNESFLLSLSRGSRMSILKGMDTVNGYYLKPFLKIFKSELLKYAKENSISFREDHTNEELHYDRNYFRNLIIPEWRRRYPSIDLLMARSIENLKLHFTFFSSLYNSWKETSVKTERNRTLIKKPNHQEELFFKEYLAEHLFHPSSINDLYLNLRRTGVKYLNQEGLTALVDRTHVILNRNNEISPSIWIHNENQIIDLPNGRIKLSILSEFNINILSNANANLSYFDLHSIQFPLLLKYWEKGDKIKPFGLKGHNKKIQDVFTDSKIDSFSKHTTAMIVEGDCIIWIPGIIRSDHHKVTNATKQLMCLEWLKE